MTSSFPLQGELARNFDKIRGLSAITALRSRREKRSLLNYPEVPGDDFPSDLPSKRGRRLSRVAKGKQAVRRSPSYPRDSSKKRPKKSPGEETLKRSLSLFWRENPTKRGDNHQDEVKTKGKEKQAQTDNESVASTRQSQERSRSTHFTPDLPTLRANSWAADLYKLAAKGPETTGADPQCLSASSVSDGEPATIVIPARDPDEFKKKVHGAKRLYKAIEDQDTTAVLDCISEGVDINYSSVYGTALHFAASHSSRADMVKLLLDNGANLHDESSETGNLNALMAACCVDDNAETIKLLLDAGADIDIQQPEDVSSGALILCCVEDREEYLSLLIRAGAQVNMQVQHKRFGSALAAASFCANVNLINILIEAGADINMQLSQGAFGSALVAACVGEQLENVQFLLDKGADVNLQITHGVSGSVLAAACAGPCTSESIPLLLSAGADVNMSLSFGAFNDAMSVATFTRNPKAIRLLFQAGAKISPLSATLIRGLVSDDPSCCEDLKIVESEYASAPLEVLKLQIDCELALLADTWKDMSTFLSNMDLLIRKKDAVELTTIQRYLCNTLGGLGGDLLRGVIRALQNPKNFFTDGTMIIDIRDVSRRETMAIECSASTPELLEIFTWLCLAVRKPAPGIIGLSKSTSEIWSGVLGSVHQLDPIQPFPKFTRDNRCWHGLFNEAVIIPAVGVKSQAPSRGLELDFMQMLRLSAVEYPVLVDSGLVLMGYSTVLVPIKETKDGMILWHLETANHESQFKVSEIKATKRRWLKVNSLEYLQSKRALLGWCSKADILLGTDQMSLDVTWSDAKVKASTWHWKGANLQVLAQTAAPVQVGAQMGVSFDRSLNTVRFAPSDNYLRCLKNSTVEQVVLYDVNTQRAWLVPLVSVLHHMLLVYSKGILTEHRGSDPPKTSIGDPDNFVSDNFASLKALADNGEVVLEQSGGILTIRELIMGFSVNLSKTSFQKPVRSEIYGYEFMDILMGSPRSELKKGRVRKDGLAWSSLLDGINCLFCSDLGDAIVGRRVPDSSPCNNVPMGSDFMVASMQSIDSLSTTHGAKSQPEFRKLSHTQFWQLSGSPFQECGEHCHGNCWVCPEFLQCIRASHSSKKSNTVIPDHSGGALVFGAPQKGKMIASATLGTLFTKPPTKIKMFELPTRLKA
ncbi:unnamed protein product [Penicillium salamii]|uniref:Uncharacterized protein n=1 Tax=Penicillium salamii TaxID=1612424 RepID=A0A9W4NTH5_9EURO|nr:unnamed protein product [Penicillium salamii]CAG8395497.1 unnamed protein product [Penicillium salamii]CAG8414670.1 unnamed protein product [Penicillium salamii]CAG8419910.1 unnamed protein product [Penicillium salamii]